MAEEEEGTPKIKVTDRRLFDREGNLREDVEESREKPPATPETIGEPEPTPERSEPSATGPDPSAGGQAPGQATPPGQGPRPGPSRPSGPESRPGGAPSPGPGAGRAAEPVGTAPGSVGEDESAAEEGRGPEDLPRDFPGFVESQYYETLLYLGAMRHPATGQVMEDLDMAKYKIDLLQMLEEKTEGNRTPEESKLLEDVLHQLRMAYLQKRKVAKL